MPGGEITCVAAVARHLPVSGHRPVFVLSCAGYDPRQDDGLEPTMGTDRDWKRWGQSDPYFGVLSDEKFRTARLGATKREEFFLSGERHIEKMIQAIKAAYAEPPGTGAALDFGSGVGRLAIPLASRFLNVTGVDISIAMIAEAGKNCEVAGIGNATFVESDDRLSNVSGTFDFVHSTIVLQHISWVRGRLILMELAKRVHAGGFAAIQILTAHRASILVRTLVRLRYLFPPANWLRNALRRRPVFEPAMQLHVYDLSVVLADFERQGFDCRVESEPFAEFTSSTLYLRRRS